jgi:hypothetical protein
MSTSLDDQGRAKYGLPLFHITEYRDTIDINEWVGKSIALQFTGAIHCVATGKKIKKTYGEGLSYDAFLTSPLNSPSIIRPELSQIHEGVALRDFEWEQKHHNQPHYVYLSRTSDIKVGVTRSTNLFSRWIDQGASEGIRLAETPYRQLAGVLEVLLKEFTADKTAWQAMLKGVCCDLTTLVSKKNELLNHIPEDLYGFIADDDTITTIAYPVIQLPTKPSSVKAETSPRLEGRLMGIKGQYWLFDGDRVFNVRAHAGHEINLTVF